VHCGKEQWDTSLLCALVPSQSPTSNSSDLPRYIYAIYAVQIISDMSHFSNPAKPLKTPI